MLDTISLNWRPSSRTSSALKNAGYSQDQLNDVGKIFIDRYLNQQINNASSTFNKMVRTSGIGRNVKAKPSNNNNKAMSENLANKAKNGAERAHDIQKNEVCDSMKLASANMIQRRFGTPFAECRAIVGLEVN